MRLTDPLNSRQLAVLGWIGDGCPPGVFDTPQQYKRTAGALQDRRLVKVSKTGGSWTATLTESGRIYLERGEFPAVPQRAALSDARGSVVVRAATGKKAPPLMSVEELLGRLATGSLTIPDPDDEVRAAWRRTIDAARRSGRVPADLYLLHQGRAHGDMIISLRRGTHPVHRTSTRARGPAIAVPDVVPELHPLLKSLGAAASQVLCVSRAAEPRALRVLHALFNAAEEQGCAVQLSGDADTTFTFRRDGAAYDLSIREVYEVRSITPDAAELSSQKTYSWQRVRSHPTSLPSGRLVWTWARTTRSLVDVISGRIDRAGESRTNSARSSRSCCGG